MTEPRVRACQPPRMAVLVDGVELPLAASAPAGTRFDLIVDRHPAPLGQRLAVVHGVPSGTPRTPQPGPGDTPLAVVIVGRNATTIHDCDISAAGPALIPLEADWQSRTPAGHIPPGGVAPGEPLPPHSHDRPAEPEPPASWPLTKGSVWALTAAEAGANLAAAFRKDSTPLRTRPFEIFGACPGCGIQAFHLIDGPFEREHTEVTFEAGPDGDDVERIDIKQWGSDRVVRSIEQPGHRVETKRVVREIDRDCLSCGQTWTEVMA